MITQTHIPRFPLNQFVDNFFFYEGYTPAHSVERFLPDGNVEFVIDLHDTPKFIYDNETLKEIQACHHVWASGLRTQPISIDSGRDAAMIVVTFKKGLAFPFFPVPMNEVADCVVDADLLWGDWISSLRERIVETTDTTRRFEILEDSLLKQFASRLSEDPCVEYAVRQILLHPDQVSFSRMSQEIGYSQKHFINMFRSRVGITPKSYLKIARFQKAINEIEQQRAVNWTTISQDCGFYDQSHFINVFACSPASLPRNTFTARPKF